MVTTSHATGLEKTLFGIGWTQHWGIQGSSHKDVCAIFYLLLEVLFFMYALRIQVLKAFVSVQKRLTLDVFIFYFS